MHSGAPGTAHPPFNPSYICFYHSPVHGNNNQDRCVVDCRSSSRTAMRPRRLPGHREIHFPAAKCGTRTRRGAGYRDPCGAGEEAVRRCTNRCMTKLPSPLRLAWLLAILVSCAPSAAKVKAAREARYKADPATLYAAVKSVTESSYKIASSEDGAWLLQT